MREQRIDVGSTAEPARKVVILPGVIVRWMEGTFVVCVAQSVLWLLLLITVAALKSNTWFLVAVGALEIFQNGFVVAKRFQPIFPPIIDGVALNTPRETRNPSNTRESPDSS
jgi:hypothetical protein